MGFLTSRVLMPIVARLGSRTIIGVGGTLFVLNMLIPDPLPLVDEFLILAGTILLSRMAKSSGSRCDRCDGCERCNRCEGCVSGRAETCRTRLDADPYVASGFLPPKLRSTPSVPSGRT